MAVDYSVHICNELKNKAAQASLHRPLRVDRYDPGTVLDYQLTWVETAQKANVRLKVDRFVGGGFAGQVYRVEVLSVDGADDNPATLAVGGSYAIKILIPPTRFSRLFRNVLYWLGFQGPFQPQSNPAAARAGALWQKFIRRAAAARFDDPGAVNNVHATFVDDNLGSCGELSDWVDGRTWQLEVDDRLDALKLWQKKKKVDPALLGSPEYRAKKEFMKRFVKLLHDIGAHEFARQYEWSTCKSQPNCLKRTATAANPEKGLVAVDFRAGLTLLPFLPMSPGDFKLIWQGIKRGSLVQFDRGSVEKLQRYIDSHPDDFADTGHMLDELKASEEIYRNSVPDITHNHVKLLYSRKLWSTMLQSAFTGWKVRGLIGKDYQGKLTYCNTCRILYFLLGLIPFFGRFLRKMWTRTDWRQHYFALISSFGYLKRALSAKAAENVIAWHRAGRIPEQNAIKVAHNPIRYFPHLLLSILPAGLHRFLTDAKFFREKLHFVFVRPIKLYFFRDLREEWMRQMVVQGQKKHILSDEDAQIVLSHLDEPYIQKYLVSLVVHLMTLPVTQIVSVTVAAIYYWTHPEMSPADRGLKVGEILVLFQIIPISPGSFCRGLYTTILALKERNFRDYNIALFLSYFKYVGYLAFPIQMSYHYPAISRFMAGHWATDAVHIVPVFGERGALLERWVFCLFYNWPLTIRRRMRKIADLRSGLEPRYWHVPLCAIISACVFVGSERVYFMNTSIWPHLSNVWYVAAAVGIACGMAVAALCAGAAGWKRIVAAAVCGAAIGIISTLITPLVDGSAQVAANTMVISALWRVFAFTIYASIGAIIWELTAGDPDLA
jgi:hypothetical protein